MKLSELLKDEETYDFSTLNLITSCYKKGFYSEILEGGLESGVGVGADFGSCMHGGIAIYYAWWGHKPESERRALAFRAFSNIHEQLFTGDIRNTLKTKHTVEQGLVSLDHYFDTYLSEDHSLKPIEVELAGAVKISPRELESPFKPFWYTFRIDGIHQRINYGDYWIRETKTTSGGVDREILKQCLSHQPRGYLYCARQFPGLTFTGYMPDVVGVMAKTLECRRTFYAKSLADSESWRSQTIKKVQSWRQRVSAFEATKDINEFWQNTGECTAYGQCSFFDLCRDGITPQILAKFKPNTWNPLDHVEVPMPDIQRLQLINPSGIKETTIV